jgi:hypothetical protein
MVVLHRTSFHNPKPREFLPRNVTKKKDGHPKLYQFPGVHKIRVPESFLINCPTEILQKLFPPTPSNTVRN